MVSAIVKIFCEETWWWTMKMKNATCQAKIYCAPYVSRDTMLCFKKLPVQINITDTHIHVTVLFHCITLLTVWLSTHNRTHMVTRPQPIHKVPDTPDSLFLKTKVSLHLKDGLILNWRAYSTFSTLAQFNPSEAVNNLVLMVLNMRMNRFQKKSWTIFWKSYAYSPPVSSLYVGK